MEGDSEKTTEMSVLSWILSHTAKEKAARKGESEFREAVWTHNCHFKWGPQGGSQRQGDISMNALTFVREVLCVSAFEARRSKCKKDPEVEHALVLEFQESLRAW